MLVWKSSRCERKNALNKINVRLYLKERKLWRGEQIDFYVTSEKSICSKERMLFVCFDSVSFR